MILVRLCWMHLCALKQPLQVCPDNAIVLEDRVSLMGRGTVKIIGKSLVGRACVLFHAALAGLGSGLSSKITFPQVAGAASLAAA